MVNCLLVVIIDLILFFSKAVIFQCDDKLVRWFWWALQPLVFCLMDSVD
jgi:hypothetical protein